MNRLILLVVGLIVAIISFGVTGQLGSNALGTVDISIISIWLFAWLSDKRNAVVYAVILGIIFDFISFIFFGYWLVVFVGTVLIIDWLKTRFLTVSSFTQAAAVLILVTTISHLTTSLAVSNFSYIEILYSVWFNVIVGSLMYYLFVMRLKMFQRWMGKRL